VESQLYLYNSHNGLLFYCSRVYDIAGSFLLENQTWLAMMLLEFLFFSPLYLFPPALAFCFGTVFRVFLNMENAQQSRYQDLECEAACINLCAFGFWKESISSLERVWDHKPVL